MIKEILDVEMITSRNANREQKESCKTACIPESGAASEAAAAAVISHREIKRYPWSSWRLCWVFFFSSSRQHTGSRSGTLYLSPTLVKCQNSAELLPGFCRAGETCHPKRSGSTGKICNRTRCEERNTSDKVKTNEKKEAAACDGNVYFWVTVFI